MMDWLLSLPSSQRLIYSGTAVLLVLLHAFVFYFPQSNHIAEEQKTIQSLEEEKTKLQALLKNRPQAEASILGSPMALHAFLGIALAGLAVAGLRELSAHSCPWDLAEFGGTAQWFPALGEVPAAPGPGRCLPAAHASTGFALFALYFALRDQQARLARWALVLAWVLGLTASFVLVARGAHFLSHALWTAWISWALNVALYALVRRLKRPA